MLKVKYINNPTSLRKYITPTILFIFIFLYFGVFFYNLYLQNLLQTKSFYPEDIVNMVFYIDDLENIDAVGQTLYNFSMVCFFNRRFNSFSIANWRYYYNIKFFGY